MCARAVEEHSTIGSSAPLPVQISDLLPSNVGLFGARHRHQTQVNNEHHSKALLPGPPKRPLSQSRELRAASKAFLNVCVARRGVARLIDEQRERVARLLRGDGEEEAVGREAQRETAARAGRERDEQPVGHAARLTRQTRPVHRVVLREQLLRAGCARAATRRLQRFECILVHEVLVKS